MDRSRFFLLAAWLWCAAAMAGGPPTNGVGKSVIEHYAKSGDTLKLRAAEFLIENMQYHYFQNSPILDKYYLGIEQINNKYKYPNCVEQYQTLYKELGDPNIDIEVVNDAEVMTSETLIDNIDRAFDDWRNGLWARHLSFDDFCEYLLPYRVCDEKITDGWRADLRKRFWWRANGVSTSDDMATQSYWAACKLNDALRELKFNNKKILPFLGLELPLSSLTEIRMGECYDYAKFTTYVMRACGIPVSMDFTPQWPDRASNHYWNSLLDNTRLIMPFMGAESNPGYPSKQGRRLAKVYRRTYSYQFQSLYAKNKTVSQRIPKVLSSPFIKDVSNEYFVGKDITVKLNDLHKNDYFAYIAVFDNKEWVPVDFAIISSERTATFCNLGRDIVYLPVYWGRNGSVPAGEIVLLELDGTVKELKPDYEKKQTITINRKYPQANRIIKFRSLMKNGVFEASNSPDFENAVVCAKISKVPFVGYDTLKVSGSDKKYRYWRYVSPEKSKCNVAEIVFFHGNDRIRPVRVMNNSESLDGTQAENAFDGDELTYYASASIKNAWVGVDMGEPVPVDQISYLPRNDDNDVVAGHTYELSYFDKGLMKSAGIKIAERSSITFTDVPSGTIYILHDIDKGNEERIFTYENNRIKWY